MTRLGVQAACAVGIMAALGFVALELRHYTNRTSLESRRSVADQVLGDLGLGPVESEEIQRIREARTASNAAIAAHDIAGVLESMSEDIRIVASGGALLEGHEEVAAAFDTQFTDFGTVYVRTPISVEVHDSGERAAEWGRWVGTRDTPAEPFRTGGSYLADWAKANGTWRIRSELFIALYCEGADCG